MKPFLLNPLIRNPYIVFLFKLVVLFVFIFVLDYSIGNILRYFYFKQESGLQFRTTYSIEKTTEDVLIFGSSRANHHYHPIIFEKKLNLSFYNTGRDKNFIFYSYAILKEVLLRYTPKIIILDFSRGELDQSPEGYDQLSSLLPYYKSHPEIFPIIELKSKYERFKLLSSIYPFNSSLFTIIIGNTQYNMKKWNEIKGYIPLAQTLNGPVEIDSSVINYELDSIKVKIYESFIRECVKSNVKLYIVCSPYYIKSIYTPYSITVGKEIAKKYNVMFFDHSNDSIFLNNHKLFADIRHLNDEGAKVFSSIVTDELIKNIEFKEEKTK